jgi:hypothetical protein
LFNDDYSHKITPLVLNTDGSATIATAPALNDNSGKVISSYWFRQEMAALSLDPLVKTTWPGYNFWDTDAAAGSKRALLKYADKELVLIRLDDAGAIVDYPFSVLASGIVQAGYGFYAPATSTGYRWRADSGAGGSFEITGSGEAVRTGWCEWRRQDNSRVAYMGYVLDGDNGLDLCFEADIGQFRVLNGCVDSDYGIKGRAGVNGAASNYMNTDWTGSWVNQWVDSTLIGQIPAGIGNTQWGVAKTIVKFNTAGSVLNHTNVSSVTDNATGSWTVNHFYWFTSADHIVVATCGGTGAAEAMTAVINTQSVSTCNIQVRNDAGLAKDPTTPAAIYAAFYGTLA